ncbi:sec-independent protein translocase protein TatB [Roseovarius halotolerans]|uniref:Sec-independent protein translocase protein TatB n=1 Tax=Roseovarius halotolerans TaxID=505353 RepID=A0A1X6YJR5_9RHOB|nr:Sec-independent protein translocase protein TatB [Roseovarius halotolerans]RKT34453.1 sec-independent protein translocase protein TatB [Roseovarius halotolerans]SLN23179.1 Sec-independent protein translocase protein TatB [Roseovarius halotolerans]
MFDLGWTELLVIGVVALIVVGPKDLPGMFRAVGNFVGKAKRMARDFSQAMNDAADEAGVKDVSESLRKATNPVGSAMDEVRKSAKSASESFTQDTMSGPKSAKTDDASGDGAGDTPGGLSEERKTQAEKIRAKSAEMATARHAREAAEAAEAAAAETAGADDAPAAPKDSKA